MQQGAHKPAHVHHLQEEGQATLGKFVPSQAPNPRAMINLFLLPSEKGLGPCLAVSREHLTMGCFLSMLLMSRWADPAHEATLLLWSCSQAACLDAQGKTSRCRKSVGTWL